MEDLKNWLWNFVDLDKVPKNYVIDFVKMEFMPSFIGHFEVFELEGFRIVRRFPVVIKRPDKKLGGLVFLKGLTEARENGTLKDFAQRFWRWLDAESIFMELLAEIEFKN